MVGVDIRCESPENLSLPHTGSKARAPVQTFASNAVDCIPYPHPLIHGRRSNDVSRLVCTTWVIRSAYAAACATQQPKPALQLSRCDMYQRPPSGPAAVGMASRRPAHVCALRVRQSRAMRSCILQACILLQGYQIQLYQPTSQLLPTGREAQRAC